MMVYVEACGCTQACRHCAVDGKPPYDDSYSLAELRNLRKEWGPLAPPYEPTVHPEFPQIMHPDLLGEGNTMLATNGFGLARRDDCREIFKYLKEAGYWGLSLTLHGLRAQHDWFVRREGAFDDILAASRRAAESGFGIHWNLFLNRENLEEVPALIELQREEFDNAPSIGIPRHRVSRRLWQYEKIRPSLQEVREALPHELITQTWKQPLEDLTEGHWLRSWRRTPDADDFRYRLEPPAWPPSPPFDRLALYFTRDRRVYLDPQCGPRVLVGRLAEGREALLSRLPNLPMPEGMDIQPEDAALREQDAELLHDRGSSVRYKAISRARFGSMGAAHPRSS